MDYDVFLGIDDEVYKNALQNDFDNHDCGLTSESGCATCEEYYALFGSPENHVQE